MHTQADATPTAAPDAAELNRAVQRLSAEVRALRELTARAPVDEAERVWRYRRQRIQKISQEETPVPLRAGPCVAMHIVPLVAFSEAPLSVDLATAEFLIFGSGGSATFDANGKLFWPEDRRQAAQRGYAHMDAVGRIEAVQALHDGFGGTQPEPVRIPYLERLVFDGARSYVKSLVKLGVSGDLLIMVTLLRVKGLFAVAREHDWFTRVPIGDDVVAPEPVRVPSAAAEDQELAKALRPVLDVLWRTAGLPRCQSFDADGNYR